MIGATQNLATREAFSGESDSDKTGMSIELQALIRPFHLGMPEEPRLYAVKVPGVKPSWQLWKICGLSPTGNTADSAESIFGEVYDERRKSLETALRTREIVLVQCRVRTGPTLWVTMSTAESPNP